MPHLHVIGVCGTAMAGIAALAREAGFHVTGSDGGVYPPMSDFLAERGIPILEPFGPANLEPAPDLVLVGNAISRGNPELEAVLDRGLPYRSGPEWLKEHLLPGRHAIVVAGTHGKTTTSSLVAWLLEHAGEKPGFLIGGIPRNFGEGARFPGGPWVVLEGDEYDTAFFDKGAKFLHYRPRTLVLNNLEYDHADIYPDLESIRRQFRLLLRTVPASGTVFGYAEDAEVEELLAHHCFSRVVRFGFAEGLPFRATLEEEGRRWILWREGRPLFTVEWALLGRHNVLNGLAAAAVALFHGIAPETVRSGLASFQGVARRLDLVAEAGGVRLYDDFAHHPTAIATTLEGLRASAGTGHLWVVLEPRSNTMRRRIHQERLPDALAHAQRVVIARPSPRGLSPEEVLDVAAVAAAIIAAQPDRRAFVVANATEAVQLLVEHLHPGDIVVVMSNGGFDGIHGRLTRALAAGRGAEDGA